MSPNFSELKHLLRHSSQEQLFQTILDYSDTRFSNVLEGVEFYHQYHYEYQRDEGAIIWQKGSAHVVEFDNYNGHDPIILFIPSLINRSNILNLNERLSMVKYLASNGIHPILIDWNEPLREEYSYDMEDYVNHYIAPIIEFLHQKYQQKIIISGYCLGGVLALSSYQTIKASISGIVLMSTPWDFDVKEYRLPKLLAHYIDSFVTSDGFIHKDMVQLLFYYINPRSYLDRYVRIADLQYNTQEADDIIAIEHWLNDGIHLTNGIAKDCLVTLCQNNALMKACYTVNGIVVDPNSVEVPVCLVTANKDRIVPKKSSEALTKLLPQCDRIKSNTGHVSLVASHKSKKELWQPFEAWVKGLSIQK